MSLTMEPPPRAIEHTRRHVVPKTQTSTENPITNLPPRDRKFTGRFDELRDLHESLTYNSTVGLSQLQSAQVQRGIGKTSLAIAYGWKHMKDYPGGVFFLHGDRKPLCVELARLAEVMRLQPMSNEQSTAEKVTRRLAQSAPSLLIIDGVETEEQWRDIEESKLLPRGNCRWLVTTRRAKLGSGDMRMLSIGRMPYDHGIRFLSAFRKDAMDRENRLIVGDIVDWFDGLPLALGFVGAYMLIKDDMTWSECRERLSGLEIGKVVTTKRGETITPDYPKFVSTMLDELLSVLPRQYAVALQYAALLPKEPIITNWLLEFVGYDSTTPAAQVEASKLKQPSVVISDLIFMQLLRSLADGHKTIGMNNVVREKLRQRLSEGNNEARDAMQIVRDFAHNRSAIVSQFVQSKAGRSELSPLLRLSDELRGHGLISEAITVTNRVVPLLNALGRDYEAIEALEPLTTMDIAAELHPSEIAVLLTNKAASSLKLGDIQVARRYMELALQIEQKNRCPDDPVLAVRHSNLAGILKSQGELLKARRHIATAVLIEERHFGPDHLNLALRHWWLGDISLAENDQEGALKAYQLAYEILTKHLPAEHPQVQRMAKIVARHTPVSTDVA